MLFLDPNFLTNKLFPCHMKFKVDSIVQELLTEIDNQKSFIQDKVVPLNEEDLTWRPKPRKWNILEVIEHLNRFGDFYLPLISDVIRRPKSLNKSDVYSSGFLGENILKRIRPFNGVVPFKTTTPSRNDPFLRVLDRSVIDQHLEQQVTLEQILNEAHVINFSKNYIKTMVSPYFKLSAGDSIRLLTYHMERHFVQLDNLVYKRENE